MNKQDILKQTLNIANIIKRKGCNIQSAFTLVKNNPELLKIDINELEKRLYLIINHNIIYALLYVEENNYSWSILKNNEFGPFIKNIANHHNNDYIIEMIIESIEKYNKITSPMSNQTLEEKIKQFDLIKKNEEGYHLK